MKTIKRINIAVEKINTKDGLATSLGKHHYFDEYGNEIFPQVGEECITLDGSIKKFPF